MPPENNAWDLLEAKRELPALSRWSVKKASPLKEIDWIVENMIAAGDVTVLVGNGNVGKSWKAAHIAMSVAAGEWVDELFKTKKGNVLWFDNENGPDENDRRVKLLDRAKTLSDVKFAPHDVFFHETHWTADTDGMSILREYVTLHDPCLVIIDSLISVIPQAQSTNEAKDMRAIIDQISEILKFDDQGVRRERPVGCLILHHTKKQATGAPADEWPTFLGSVDIRNAVSFMMLMKEKVFTTSDGETHKRVQWRSDKHRRGRKDENVYEFELIDHEKDTPNFWVEYVCHGVERKYDEFIIGKINEALKDGEWINGNELYEKIEGLPEDKRNRNKLLSDLVKQGKLKFKDPGKKQPFLYAKISE